jgi:hypothetical protein
MKRAHLDRLRSDEFRHATTHLVGGFVRKRQCHDLLRRHAGGDEVGDSVGHDTRLAASGAC